MLDDGEVFFICNKQYEQIEFENLQRAEQVMNQLIENTVKFESK